MVLLPLLTTQGLFTGARRNIENLLDHKHFEVIRHDVTFPSGGTGTATHVALLSSPNDLDGTRLEAGII
jgi:hypothetical protein